MIEFHAQTPFKLTQIRRIKKLINTISQDQERKIESLSIVFTSDDYLLDLNRKFLSHDYYTDILTFDYSGVGSTFINGELFISIDRARENANQHNVSIDNETLRLIIHGTLHLLGYQDESKTERNIMTLKENHYLQIF
jgi:rRNA maturation RNase YbeY